MAPITGWLVTFRERPEQGTGCLGGPGDDVKGIEAADGIGTAQRDHVGDPAGAVGADVGDQLAARLAELEEEAVESRFVAALVGPDQAFAIVVDHHYQVALTLTETDLVDTDPTQIGEPVLALEKAAGDPDQNPTHAPPADSHQASDGSLRAFHRQPSGLLLEGAREAGIVVRPGHRRHHHAVLRAAHPRCLGLDERRRGGRRAGLTSTEVIRDQGLGSLG